MSNENKVVLPEPVSDEQIKAVFLANGFTIKEGLTDLKPYVYQAARALLATGGQAQAVWDGKLPESLQRALNELRIDCKTDAVSSLEFEVRSVFEGMHTSLTTVKHMYHAAQKRLDSTDAAQPDPFAAPQAQADARDAALLAFLQDQCIDLRCFTTSDGEDVGWRTVQHHMSEPRERVVSEVYGDQPRRAIREAMARIERDPYCTGPLHLEDAAAIAAAKGE